MLRVLFDLLWTGDQTHIAPAFPTPALRKKTRRNGAPAVLVDADKIKNLGYPAPSQPFRMLTASGQLAYSTTQCLQNPCQG